MKSAFLAIAMFMVFGIGNITYSAGNYALSFDPADHVKCGTNNLPDGTSERTMEAWFKTDQAFASHVTILCYGKSGTAGGMFSLLVSPDRVLVFSQWGAGFAGGTIVTDGKWHHVAVSYNGKRQIIYLDGNFEADGNVLPFDTVLDACIIGARADAVAEFFNGTIDEARIWSVARTEEEIKEDMGKELNGNEPGLVSYWNFNEGKGTILHDLTASGNDGELVDDDPEWVEGAPVETSPVDVVGKLAITWGRIKSR